MKKVILVCLLMVFSFPVLAAEKESVYDRVMKTGTIKCGYIQKEPYLMIDPNTGKKSGIFYDVTEEIGKRLELKIEWTEEVGWGTYIEGLKSRRYDMVCSGGWNGAIKGKAIGYTSPVYYVPLGIWVREGDKRFSEDFSLINSPDVRIVSTDGSVVSAVAQSDFPEAKIYSLPDFTPVSEMMLNVVNKKADVTFLDTYTGGKFLENNPNTVVNIAKRKPLRLFATSLYVPHEDHQLKATVNAALGELMDSGTIDTILDKYDPDHKLLYRVAKPYEVTQ